MNSNEENFQHFAFPSPTIHRVKDDKQEKIEIVEEYKKYYLENNKSFQIVPSNLNEVFFNMIFQYD